MVYWVLMGWMERIERVGVVEEEQSAFPSPRSWVYANASSVRWGVEQGMGQGMGSHQFSQNVRVAFSNVYRR